MVPLLSVASHMTRSPILVRRLQLLLAITSIFIHLTTTIHAEPVDPPIEQPPTALITGNLNTWDLIFASRTPQLILDGRANNIHWTEGPVLVGEDDDVQFLLFSDTVGGKLYSFDLASRKLQILKDRSGDASPADDHWRAEPGSNGLAVLVDQIDGGGGGNGGSSPKLLVCQHGARRVVTMNLKTHEIEPLATEYNGKKLNGPNDICIRSEKRMLGGERGNTHALYAYFTDPVYAWLEKDRFDDLPYLDETVREKGPGHCGVYRVEIQSHTTSDSVNKGNVELITLTMARPNGIGFDRDNLIVSDCCQGSHLDGCTSGTSRWEILRQRVVDSSSGNNYPNEKSSPSGWVHSSIVEDIVSAEQAVGGCADGFAVYNLDDYNGGGEQHFLLASCFGGFCIVDLTSETVVARIWTAKDEYGGCRISNVVVGRSRVYLTGSCGIFMLPLRIIGDDDGLSYGVISNNPA